MERQGISVSTDIWFCLLHGCIKERDQAAGREAHWLIVRNGVESDPFLGNCLIRMYSAFASLEEANQIFRKLSNPDVFSWSAIISAHSKLGQNEQAIKLYHQMVKSNGEPDGHIFVLVLKACSSLFALCEGKQIHTFIIESGSDSDLFVTNTLIDLYTKCGSLDDACTVFNRLHERDVVTWSAVIAGYVQNGYPWEAIQLFHQMQEKHMEPNQFTFVCLLKACSSIETLQHGRQIHFYIIESGFESDLFVSNTLIDTYAKCGRLDHACTMFNRLPNRDVVTWSALIAGYAQQGLSQEALQLLHKMEQEGTEPDEVTYICLLKSFCSLESLLNGKQIHSRIIEHGLESDLFVASTLIDMYSKCESLKDAHIVFDRLSKRNVVMWNALIAGNSQHGKGEEAFQLFQQMQQDGIEPDKVTYICMLAICCCTTALEQGKRIHCQLIESGFELDVIVGNSLIDMYIKCGSFKHACTLFDKLPRRDVVTLNAMIAGYCQDGHAEEALQFVLQMQLQGTETNHATWIALIAGHSQLGCLDDAFSIFQQMQQQGLEPDKATFVSILQVCSNSGVPALEQGKQIHTHLLERGFGSDLVVANTLIDMYAKCGSLEAACLAFDRLPKQDIVSWNVLIAGHIQHDDAQLVFKLFQHMQEEGMVPDQATFISILQACSRLAALERGKQTHTHICDSGYESDLFVGSSLIDMYSKCGNMADALVLFDRLPNRDDVTWSTLIAGYAQHNDYALALRCFNVMMQTGLEPTGVTFLSLLSACSHAGLVHEGCLQFKLMRDGHRILPLLEHHNSLVELLGRAGYLEEAEELLETIPLCSNSSGWTSLLTSCRTYGHVKLGKRCFDLVIAMDNESSSGYMLLSSIYRCAGMKEGVQKMEDLRKHVNLWKKPAKAFIEIDNQVHGFCVHDNTHPQSDDIYAKLRMLSMQMMDKRYASYLELVPNSLSSDGEENDLCGHSEKLAIAFGLLCTPKGTTIRITKDLRVCADCHNAARMISKMEMRNIIIKDTYCIHHFKDGACCCKDDHLYCGKKTSH